MFDKDNQEAIELMVDLHNDVNDDALKLISEYYLDITNPIGTKITDISEKEKNSLRKALLNYCELDTLAMVMLFEHLDYLISQ